MALFGSECPHCGAKVKSGAKFCPSCGKPVGKATITHTCGAQIPANAKFCPSCGKAVTGETAPTMAKTESTRKDAGNRWVRQPDDFATRIEVADVKGLLNKGLIVEPGTKAILIVDGKYEGTVPSGKYDIGGFKQKFMNFDFSRKTTAILMDDSDVKLTFSVPGLLIVDAKVQAECDVVCQMQEPILFVTNLMKGKSSYQLNELKAEMFAELRNALASAVKEKKWEELSGGRSTMDDIQMALSSHMRTSFQRYGLSFVQVRAASFHSTEKEKLDAEKREQGIKKEKLWLERNDTELEINDLQARIDQWNRLRDGQNLDKMSLAARTEEWEEFETQVIKKKFMRENEWQALQATVAENEEDRQSARQHLLDKIDMQRGQDLALLQQKFKQEIAGKERTEELEEVRHQITKMSMLKESERNDLEQTVLQEISLKQRQHEANLQDQLATTQNAAERRKIEMEIERMEADQDNYESQLGMKQLAQMKAIKREDEEERLRMEREHVSFMKKLDHQIEMEKEKAGRDHEIKKMQTMSEMSPEALIASSGSEQAAMLADLKKTESMKGMSDDQILAMAAANSPEVAKAFQEKFKGANTEQMVERERERAEEMKNLQNDNLDRMERMFNKTVDMKNENTQSQMDQQKQMLNREQERSDKTVDQVTNVATARAGNPGSAAGQQQESAKIVCPSCTVETERGTQFCANCGHKFFD